MPLKQKLTNYSIRNMAIDRFSTIRAREDGTWDLNTVLTQQYAIEQNLLIALREHRNDFFMALDTGLDSTTINDKTDNEIIKDIENVILEQKGITSTKVLKFKRDGQKVDIVFLYNTILGESNTIVAEIIA